MQIGIIGCGRMGNERARATVALGHKIAAVYDPDISKAKTLAASYPASAVLQTPGQISWPTLDAVFICTPPSFRTHYELAAIEANVPFFVEKPIGVEAPEGFKVFTALQRKSIINAVGYMNRCRDSIMFARQLLARHSLLGACCHWLGRKYKVDWWLQSDQSGGPLNEQATHVFDLFRFLVGEISAVTATARGSTEASMPPLAVACALKFSSGQLGTIFYSCEAADKQINLRIITADGALEFTGWDLRLIVNTIDGSLPIQSSEDIFMIESARFLNAIERNDPSLVHCNFADAYRTQLAVDAARRSLVTGHIVSTESHARLEAAV